MGHFNKPKGLATSSGVALDVRKFPEWVEKQYDIVIKDLYESLNEVTALAINLQERLNELEDKGPATKQETSEYDSVVRANTPLPLILDIVETWDKTKNRSDVDALTTGMNNATVTALFKRLVMIGKLPEQFNNAWTINRKEYLIECIHKTQHSELYSAQKMSKIDESQFSEQLHKVFSAQLPEDHAPRTKSALLAQCEKARNAGELKKSTSNMTNSGSLGKYIT